MAQIQAWLNTEIITLDGFKITVLVVLVVVALYLVYQRARRG